MQKLNRNLLNNFTFFNENLYVVHLPNGQRKETTIENLFSDRWLKTKIDGKTFNPKSNFDKNKEYSKIVFAEKVIKANQVKIDFSEFKPLFDRIEETIDDFNQ